MRTAMAAGLLALGGSGSDLAGRLAVVWLGGSLLPPAAGSDSVWVAGSDFGHEEFVRNMYRAILCREGDEGGVAEKVHTHSHRIRLQIHCHNSHAI